MRFNVIGVSTGVALVFSSLAASAEVTIITPDESVLVERYIEADPELPPPVTLETNTVLRPGSPVPEAIPLRPFNGVSNLARLGYFVSVDRKIVVVDPATRRVVRIFDERRR